MQADKNQVQEEMSIAKDEKASTDKRVPLFIIITFMITALTCVFAVLCLHAVPLPFFRAYATLFSWLVCLLLITVFCLSAFWIYKQKDTLFKTVFSALILLLFCVVLLFVLLKTGFFNVIRSKKSLEEYLAKTGVWMPIFYVVLQYLQVVVLPIPSTVSTLAGVALFGPLQTLLYSMIGIMLGSLTAFFIGRKLGYKAVAWIVGEETLHKWQNKLKGKDNFLLTLMFVLPVFPDDVLCFVAGLSSMSNAYFISMLTISRILSVSVTCYSIQLIPFDTIWGLAIWAAFFLVVVVGFILAYKHLDAIHAWFNKRFPSFRNKKK